MALNIDGTTSISGVDGSVSAPALTGTDSNTGITFPAADTIKFATGGVERMSITNSGVFPSGHIIQVVEGSTTSTVSTTSAGYIDTGLSQAITPLQTGSQILVIVSQHVGFERYSTSNGASLKLFQDSTVLYDPPQLYESYLYVGGSFMSLKLRAHFQFKHAHGKTAGTSTTYKIQGAMQQATNSADLRFQGNGMRSSIVLMEIAA